MNYDNNENSEKHNLPTTEPGQQHTHHEGEKDPDEEGTLLKEEDEKGMDMGTTFKEDKEQDLDELIHNQARLRKNEFPRPEDV